MTDSKVQEAHKAPLTFDSYSRSSLEGVPVRPLTEDLSMVSLGIMRALGKLSHLVMRLTLLHRQIERDRVVHELGAVLWYVNLAAHALGVPLEDVARENLAASKGVK